MAGIRFATIQYHHEPIVKAKDGKEEMTIGQMIDAQLSTRVHNLELVTEVCVQFDTMDSADMLMLRDMYEGRLAGESAPFKRK